MNDELVKRLEQVAKAVVLLDRAVSRLEAAPYEDRINALNERVNEIEGYLEGGYPCDDGPHVADCLCDACVAEDPAARYGANLIAAAPDMLKALKALQACARRRRDLHGKVPNWREAWRQASNAVNKAEGRA